MKKTKITLIAVAFALVLTVAIGSTIAYFTQKKTITNVFVIGDGVDVEFDEEIDPSATPSTDDPNTNEFPLIPGHTFIKDPYATVGEKSEDFYLFVKVVTSGDYCDKLLYEMDEAWDEFDAANKIYVIEVKDVTAETVYHVFKDGTVTVDASLTQEELEAIETLPTIDVMFYAIQMDGFDTAAAAWAEVTATPTPQA